MLVLPRPHQVGTALLDYSEKTVEAVLRQLSSTITRAAAETAGAFFCAATSPDRSWSGPRLNNQGALHCSQKNMGEKYEMTCNLSVDKIDWDKMFSHGESDQFKLDTFCEMANCICGTVLGNPNFSDEFGNMIPCVPFSAPSTASPGSHTLRGAFRLSGITIFFSFSILEN